MQSVDGGDADEAVEDKSTEEWNKFRQLMPLLANNDVSLLMREKLYRIYVQRHGGETWPIKKPLLFSRASRTLSFCP